MNKYIITASALVLAGGVATATYHITGYMNDPMRNAEILFDKAEEAHTLDKEAVKRASLLLEQLKTNEMKSYELKKDAQCNYAFVKLQNKMSISDDTYALCGIVKPETKTVEPVKTEQDLSLE